MGRSMVWKTGFAIVCAVLVGACGSSSPTAPSINLAGSWTGSQKVVGGTDTMPATWTASQSGTSVSGPFTLTTKFGDSSTMATITGTMTGTISGSQVTLNESFPAGAFAAAGLPSCSVTSTGTATLSGSTISATLAVTFSSACGGPTTETDTLSLTK